MKTFKNVLSAIIASIITFFQTNDSAVVKHFRNSWMECVEPWKTFYKKVATICFAKINKKEETESSFNFVKRVAIDVKQRIPFIVCFVAAIDITICVVAFSVMFAFDGFYGCLLGLVIIQQLIAAPKTVKLVLKELKKK